MDIEIPDSLRSAAQERWLEVQDRIARAAARAGRSSEDVALVGVAKRQPVHRVLATISAGLRVLGQSYVQEARRVRPEIEASLAGESGLRLEWRMVGRLQRNKAGLAVRLFDSIESVDRVELAEALSRRAVEQNKELEVLIQVSLADEPQKGGCPRHAASGLAEVVLGLPNLRLGGLMTVPAANPDPEAARPVFAALRELRGELARLDPDLAGCALSMGMSGDFEVAIEEGATLVRVGTALFGDRVDPAT
jgi:pyridoxal phosphate enzyme (YggS family)